MHILGIDQGTSGSKAMILDRDGNVRGTGYRPVQRLHPQPDRTEQDPLAVARGVSEAIADALADAGCAPRDIAACGIATQRNTDFVWDAATGRPIANAISWQDLRTDALLAELRADAALWGESLYRLGQHPGPYSAAVHLGWRMRHDPAVIEAAAAGRLRIGLSAAWLLVALGNPRAHQMDYSLVQSMSLFDFRSEDYWGPYLDWLRVPREALPRPVPSVHDYGTIGVVSRAGTRADVPVLAMLGDQQAALFGYDCRAVGQAECTHGTATYVDVCTGGAAPAARHMQSYFAWVLPAAEGLARTYCLEADATVTGAVIRWMRESARLLDDEKEIGALAASVPDAGGVTFVPAFTGLNVPYQDSQARGTLLGLTLGVSRAHIARAFLDALGFQVRAILEQVRAETGIRVTQLKVGGGISASDTACRIQADWLGIPLSRPTFTDTTPRAAALLAGLGAGIWPSLDALPELPEGVTVFDPAMSDGEREAGFERWNRAVALARAYRA